MREKPEYCLMRDCSQTVVNKKSLLVWEAFQEEVSSGLEPLYTVLQTVA